MKAYIYIHRRKRTVHASIELDRDNVFLDPDSLSDAIYIALLQTQMLLYPLHVISIISMQTDDIPDNIGSILEQIGSLPHFKMKLYFGTRNRRRRYAWSKKPIKQFAHVHIGKFIERNGKKRIIYYCDVLVWLTFKKHFPVELLSGHPPAFQREDFFIKKRPAQ